MVLSVKLQAQHTIFPKTGIAINCKIEKLTNDSIFYYPEWDTTSLKSINRIDVKHYTYNEEFNEQSAKEKSIQIVLDSTKIEGSQSYHLIMAGTNIKEATILKLVSIIPAAIAPFTVKFEEKIEKVQVGSNYIDIPTTEPNYTIPIALTTISVGLNVASFIKMFQAGKHLEKAGNVSQKGFSFYFLPSGGGIAYRF